MSDLLVDLGARRSTRTLISMLGLPIPLPQKLKRDVGPWQQRPLHDKAVLVHATGELSDALARAVTGAGANPWVEGPLDAFHDHGAAWGRPPQAPTETEPSRPHALVFDATALRTPDALRELYDVFHPRIRGLAACGRVVVLGRPHEKLEPSAAAAQRALEGFVRSVAREVGRKGATANLVVVEPGAEDRVEPLLRFLLSYRSAYVSGQPIRVGKRVKLDGEPPVARPLQGKTALVTGAARGIGAAIARTLAREGAHVIVLDRPADDAPLAEVAREVRGTPLMLDVTDPEAGLKIATAADAHGGLDVVVHNAGVTRDKTLAKMDADRWDQTLGINLASVARLLETVPVNRNGRIVLLSSIAGIAGNVGQTNYAASKAGVIGLVEAWSPKLAKKGVTINAIAPGFIETRLTAAIPVATREVARRLSNLSQGGLPEDIAEVATFLSSPGAAGVSGQTLRVCGGNFVGA